MKNISKKNWVLYIVTFLVVVIGDQLTKILVFFFDDARAIASDY